MESPTTSTCEPYRQSGQKRCRKFYARKPAKKERRTRVHAKTAEVGCVLGAGEDGNGWGRVKPDEKTRCPNQNAPDSNATHEKRKPAKTLCFRRFFGRGRRTWSRLLPRVLLPGGERPAPTEAGAETGSQQSATGARSPLGTRFWSGCGRAHLGAGKGLCCPVLSDEPQKRVAVLVLRELFWS